MKRRLALLATLMLFGLTGCVSYGDGYYRDSYYSDDGYYGEDGYYYPADEGYGDYYEGDSYDSYYSDYDTSYGYSPFWSLDRYSCGAYYSCSPYWNGYYRRPYSFSLGFGNQWSYGQLGWYGQHWSPWYSHGYYPRPPRHDRDEEPRGQNGPRPLYREPGTGNARSYPRGDTGPRSVGGEPAGGTRPWRDSTGRGPGHAPSGDETSERMPPRYRDSAPGEPVRSMGGEPAMQPRPDYREIGSPRQAPRGRYLGPESGESTGARPAYRESSDAGRRQPAMTQGEAYRPAPDRSATPPVQREYREPPRTERREYIAPPAREYREPTRQEPRESRTPEPSAPRGYSAPERPAPPPRAEPQPAREARTSSQNESRDDQ